MVRSAATPRVSNHEATGASALPHARDLGQLDDARALVGVGRQDIEQVAAALR